jgi:hypothetical protein
MLRVISPEVKVADDGEPLGGRAKARISEPFI